MTSVYSLRSLTRKRPWTSSTDSLHSSHHPAAPTSVIAAANHTTTATSSDASSTPALHRRLGLTDLIFYGVGCSVGAGIYSLVGLGARRAGPAVAASLALCGGACCATALSYAEWSARVPAAGSAYVFTYAAFGEIWAWMVGWNLTLGYSISAAVVARSWAEYVVGFVQGWWGIDAALIERWTTKVPLSGWNHGITDDNHDDTYTCCPLAMVIVALCTAILVTGAKESTRFNTAMTILNLAVLVSVWILAAPVVRTDNLVPFLPHGVAGLAQGAGLVFFSYLGFDMVACLSEEVKQPERNMPIGIVGSLLVTMVIYVTTSLAVVGMAPEPLLGPDTPITNALLANACCTHQQQLLDTDASCISYAACTTLRSTVLYVGSRLVAVGAMFGLTTATFACLMGQPRIFYSMAQDGLLFPIYAQVSPTTGVPTAGTLLTGVGTAVVACLLDLETLSSAISLGTLQVFTFVNAGVILLRTSPGDGADVGQTQGTVDESTALLPPPPSPLVRDPQAAATARSLGLVKDTSLHILQSSVRGSTRLFSVEHNGRKPIWLLLTFTLSAIVASAVLSSWETNHNESTFAWQAAIICTVLVVVVLGAAVVLARLPQSPPPTTFTCPGVPMIPLFGILCNSYMMGSMPASTWMMIGLWLGAGLIFYFSYGVRHSVLNKAQGKPPVAASSSTGQSITMGHYQSTTASGADASLL